MTTVPHRKIQVIGGKLKKETEVLFFSFLEEHDSHLVVPRLIVTNQATDGEVYLEISAVEDKWLACKLSSIDVFRTMNTKLALENPRHEVIWDMALAKLTQVLSFDIRPHPKSIKMKLMLKGCPVAFTGSFEDAPLTQFLLDLFDFEK